MVQITLTEDQMQQLSQAKEEEVLIADHRGNVILRFARFAKSLSEEEEGMVAEAKHRLTSPPAQPPLLFSDLIHRLEAEYPCGDSQ